MFSFEEIVTGKENYIEIVLVSKKINEKIYEIDFSEEECSKYIRILLNKFPDTKFFKKHSTKYMYDFLEMNHYSADNLKTVYNVQFLKHYVKKMNHKYFIANMYDKKLLPNHAFPSTIDINDIVDSKRLTMKITNNIYINIDSLQYSDGNIYRHIFINMNIKKTNDILHTSEIVNDIITTLDV